MLLPADEGRVDRCARHDAAILAPLVLAIEGDRRTFADARQDGAKLVHDRPQPLLDRRRVGIAEAGLSFGDSALN